MASLLQMMRRKPAAVPPAAASDLPAWARPLFASALAPLLQDPDGQVRVWQIRDDASQATITDQFKANAEEYHRRYSASDHFEKLFRQALEATGAKVARTPKILDLGSGSGVNSVVPCRRLFPGARIVATDLSGELLALLAEYLAGDASAEEVVCVKMDAMSDHVSPGAFDLVTGASILHHLEHPEHGIAAAARALKPGGQAIFFEPFNGWGIVRAAFERVLVEGDLRGEALDPVIRDIVQRLIRDIEARSRSDRSPEEIAALDDKWLFSREAMAAIARKAGFSQATFVAHNDHPTLYRDSGAIYLRLATGRSDLELPEWAVDVLRSFDEAFTREAKRELMLEGTIVLTK